jgi:hypothetical protein
VTIPSSIASVKYRAKASAPSGDFLVAAAGTLTVAEGDDDELVELVVAVVDPAVLADELDGALVDAFDELDDEVGGDSAPPLQPATSAPPSTTAATRPNCRERTPSPLPFT